MKMKHSVNQRKLRNLFINNIQLKLSLINLIYLSLILTVVVIAVLAPFYSDMSRTADLYNQHLAANIFIALIEKLFIALIAIFLFSLLHQIIISHRLCGPLVNFNKTFEKISQGDLTRKVFLRRHDFLKNEASRINGMIDSLSGIMGALKKDHDRLLETLELLERDSVKHKIFGEQLKTANHQARLCAGHLSKIKIENAPPQEEN